MPTINYIEKSYEMEWWNIPSGQVIGDPNIWQRTIFYATHISSGNVILDWYKDMVSKKTMKW